MSTNACPVETRLKRYVFRLDRSKMEEKTLLEDFTRRSVRASSSSVCGGRVSPNMEAETPDRRKHLCDLVQKVKFERRK